MMRTSQPGWNEGAITLSASRSRRRTRLRTTAPPSSRPVDSPNRVVPRSVRRKRAWISGWDREIPSRCNAAKSRGLVSITSRGGFWPRASVRPSAAFGPSLGEPRGRDGPRSTSSGRGSRAPWRDAASWAGRSASWGCRAILSIGLGAVGSTPRGTRTRRAPESAWRVVVRRMIRRARTECQTYGRGFRAVRVARRVGRPALHRYSMGVCVNRCRIALQARTWRCYPSPAQRRRDARWEAF
jgi:hypothetical protein